MKFIWLIALFLALSAQQCAKDIDTETLTTKWGHSHEEDAAGVLVYRPHTFDFPMARGREWFEFKKEGIYVQHDIAPTDGNVALPGTWKPDPDNASSLLIELNTKPEASYRMEIVELTKEVLKFRKLSSQ